MSRSAEDYANVALIPALNNVELPAGTSIRLVGLTKDQVTVEINVPHKFERVREIDPERVFYDGEYADVLNSLESHIEQAFSWEEDRRMRAGSEIYMKMCKLRNEARTDGKLNGALCGRMLEIMHKLIVDLLEADPLRVDVERFLENDNEG